MKVLICLAVIAALAAAAPPPELLAAYEKCQKDFGVSDELVKKVKLKEFDFENDKNGVCYVKCVGVVFESLDGDFKILPAVFEKKLPEISPDKFKKATEKCNALSADNDCLKTFKRFQCFFNELPELVKQSRDFYNGIEKCEKDNGVSPEIVKKVKSHIFDFEDDKNGLCYVKCVGHVFGSLDKDFNIVTDKMEKQHPELGVDKLRKAATTCNALKAADDCATSYKRFQCFFKEVPEFPVFRKA